MILLIIGGLVLGNVRIGKTQSETDWTLPVNISQSGISSNPVAVVDVRGNIHAIWVDEIDGYRYSRSPDGVRWTPPLAVAFPFSSKDYTPFLLADSNGSIHVFWITQRFELFYSQTTPDDFVDPSKWITTRLSRGASNFDVVIDAQGALHIVYIGNFTDALNTAGIYYRKSIIGGGFWSEPKTIYHSEYFRATTSLNTYVRVAVSNTFPGQKVYISWDNRPQKRIFLATSVNEGETWSAAQQFKGPDDIGGYGTPFNFTVWAGGKNLLLMWQVGEPGASKCSVYSQWSGDGGNTWGDIILLFGGPTTCPTNIKSVLSQNGKVAVLLNNIGDPILLAWDGVQWSEPQSQIRLPALSNPATYDAILLGCRQDIFYKDKLFVIGCDQTKEGADIWFLSRSLVPMEEWFSPFSIWGDPQAVEIEEKDTSFLTSATDTLGNIHVVWVESSHLADASKPSISYLRWEGSAWTGPETIIQNLDGQPLQLTLHSDSQSRLMLAWVDGSTGDLLFSWANLDQANLPSGWATSTVLPSPSQFNSSPDVIVDSTGRIVVAYAITHNEDRGIYIVQSTDNGFTWSPYIQVFDGVLAQWELVDAPKITLDGDGVLHLLFIRRSSHIGQPVGLYYTQSKDGGMTWSDPGIVSKGEIFWSDIVSYDNHTVHRLWQEENELVVANLSQVSLDGGATWDKLLDVTGVSETVTPVALATNGTNGLYFVQLVRKNIAGAVNRDTLVLQDWKWDGTRWNPEAARDLNVNGMGLHYSVVAGITSNDYLDVSLSATYVDVAGETRNEIINISRFLEGVSRQAGDSPSIIPTSLFQPEEFSDLSLFTPTPTPVANRDILFDSNDPSEGMTRNFVGIGLIGLAVLVTVLLVIRRKPRKKTDTDVSDQNHP